MGCTSPLAPILIGLVDLARNAAWRTGREVLNRHAAQGRFRAVGPHSVRVRPPRSCNQHLVSGHLAQERLELTPCGRWCCPQHADDDCGGPVVTLCPGPVSYLRMPLEGPHVRVAVLGIEVFERRRVRKVSKCDCDDWMRTRAYVAFSAEQPAQNPHGLTLWEVTDIELVLRALPIRARGQVQVGTVSPVRLWIKANAACADLALIQSGSNCSAASKTLRALETPS